MKPYAKWVTRLLSLATLLAPVALGVPGSAAPASAAAIQVSDNTASGAVSARPPDVDVRGQELYNASCAVCHGARGTGDIGPRLANNPVLRNDREFWKIVHEGRHVMPPLKGVVNDQQLDDIRAWLRSLH